MRHEYRRRGRHDYHEMSPNYGGPRMRHHRDQGYDDERRGEGRGGEGRGNGGGGRGRGGRGPEHHRGHRRGGRARRGDVRLALIALLGEEQANGYALIKKIQEKTDGVWRTSPGSVYPTLAQLVDEGLIALATEGAGRNEYALTDEGRGYLKANESAAEALWVQSEDDLVGADALRHAKHGLFAVLRRIESGGDAEEIASAVRRVNRLAEKLEGEAGRN